MVVSGQSPQHGRRITLGPPHLLRIIRKVPTAVAIDAVVDIVDDVDNCAVRDRDLISIEKPPYGLQVLCIEFHLVCPLGIYVVIAGILQIELVPDLSVGDSPNIGTRPLQANEYFVTYP